MGAPFVLGDMLLYIQLLWNVLCHFPHNFRFAHIPQNCSPPTVLALVIATVPKTILHCMWKFDIYV